jgi:small-conductance mechanosensitive channel
MNANLLAALLADLWEDMRAPAVLWQLVALAVSIGLGWLLARAVRGAVAAREPERGASSAVRLGLDSFARVLAPLCVLGFVVLSRVVLGQWQKVPLLRVAIPVVASLAAIRFVFYLLRRIFARGREASAVLVFVERVFALLVWLAVALYITGMWVEVVDFMDRTHLPLGGKHDPITLMMVLQALISVAVTLLLALWAGAALETRLMGMDGLHTSLRVVFARLGRAVLIVVAVLMSLRLVGIDLTVLSVFSGALGVGLGLGLQKIASNYVSGFVILLERSLSIGDLITVDKYHGKVTQINTRYTVLDGLDGVEAVIPNEMLVSGAVQNHTLNNSALRLSVQLTVAFDADVEALLPALERCAAGVTRVVAQPAPFATLARIGPDGFALDLGFWIMDPENGRGNVVSEVNRAVWRLLREQGVALPSPLHRVRLLDERAADSGAQA